MDDIKQNFLDEAISKLDNLLPKLSGENLDENLRREIFRALHTLKGTAQTLGFNASGKLAHELENLLQYAGENPADKKFAALLNEGTKTLRETFVRFRTDDEVFFPKEFIEKLRSLIPENSAADSDFFSADIPPGVLKKLSAPEKKSLREALAGGKNFYAVEVEFGLFDFDEKFRALLETLKNKGEIIANFPKPDVSDAFKIGFRVYLTSRAAQDKLAEMIQIFDAHLVNYNPPEKFAGGLKGVLEQAVSAGKKASFRLDKTIEFETRTDNSQASSGRLKLLSEILPHLVRNAADHAIEKSGTIKIEINSDEQNLIVRVADDGRGLDAEKIRRKAVEKNLIRTDENLSREEIFDFVFAHGFSTADKISEISGRGVGLDAVRDAVENSGGGIKVESEPGEGTLFEIRLPKEL